MSPPTLSFPAERYSAEQAYALAARRWDLFQRALIHHHRLETRHSGGDMRRIRRLNHRCAQMVRLIHRLALASEIAP